MSSSPHGAHMNEHVFSSSATVFTLEEKNWNERGCGLVKFIFDLSSYQLRLVIRPQTPEEFECRLRPRIRSKGPRAYVVRANSRTRDDEEGEELILAIRFDREIDSRAFRRFVEERDQPSMSNFTDGRHASQPMAAAHAQQSGTLFRGAHIQSAEQERDYGGDRYQQGHRSHPYPADEQATAEGFFWSCSRCTMMNDAQAPACYVCGTQRGMPVGRDGGGGNARDGDVPMPHYGSGGGGAGVYGHGPGYHGHASTTPTPASPQPERMQVQLTQQNLERLNLLYPPKKRPVLECILEQLRLQERLSMADSR